LGARLDFNAGFAAGSFGFGDFVNTQLTNKFRRHEIRTVRRDNFAAEGEPSV
jgi:hypothetical protein